MTKTLQPRPNRTERFDARLTLAQKAILEQAAALDDENLSTFVVRSAMRAAKRRLLEEETIRVTERDRRALVNALMSPPSPNSALRKAYARYRKDNPA